MDQLTVNFAGSLDNAAYFSLFLRETKRNEANRRRTRANTFYATLDKRERHRGGEQLFFFSSLFFCRKPASVCMCACLNLCELVAIQFAFRGNETRIKIGKTA